MSGPLYFDDRDDWLAWRRMGGTTISAVLGVNPWQSPLHAYLTLTGLIMRIAGAPTRRTEATA